MNIGFQTKYVINIKYIDILSQLYQHQHLWNN